MGGGRLLVRRRWVLGGLAVAAASAALAPAASAVVVHTSTGRFFGVMRRAGVTLSRGSGGTGSASAPRAAAAVTSTGMLEYHGGPVLHTTRPYLVFWGSGIGGPTQALFARYMTDTAADSAIGDDVFGVSRQYSDATGYAAAGESYGAGQAISDSQPYPTVGNCARKSPPITTCLTDVQIQAELRRLIAADGLPSGIGPGAPVYFVILPGNVNVCMTGSQCADNYFCAYHTNATDNGTNLIYATIPLLNAVKNCQLDSSPLSALQEPNGIPADVAIDTLSHEYNESITDPVGDAWYDDGSNNEEADYCQQFAGTRDAVTGTDPHAYAPVLGTAANGSLFDQRINGDPYYTQSEWSNGQNDCELAASTTQLTSSVEPAPTIAVGAAAHLVPGATTATAGVSSTTWTFGDGSSAFTAGSPTAQTHAYAAPGVYTVSMTLVDGGGQVATFTRQITVDAPPIAAFSQSTAVAGAPLLTRVAFDASGSSEPQPGAHIVSYRWAFGDGAMSFQGPTTGYSYTNPGSYTVSLTVTGSDGLTATASLPIRVVEVPAVTLAWHTSYPAAGHAIAFAATPGPAGGARIVSYRWDFGDGRHGSGAQATHTFGRPGTYWVAVGLTTSDGLTRTSFRLLHVNPAEAVTKLRLSAAAHGALRLRAAVNGPGTLIVAGSRYRLAKAGSISCTLALSRAQRRALRHQRRLVVRVRVRFDPLSGGRPLVRTARLTMTG